MSTSVGLTWQVAGEPVLVREACGTSAGRLLRLGGHLVQHLQESVM